MRLAGASLPGAVGRACLPAAELLDCWFVSNKNDWMRPSAAGERSEDQHMKTNDLGVWRIAVRGCVVRRYDSCSMQSNHGGTVCICETARAVMCLCPPFHLLWNREKPARHLTHTAVCMLVSGHCYDATFFVQCIAALPGFTAREPVTPPNAS